MTKKKVSGDRSYFSIPEYEVPDENALETLEGAVEDLKEAFIHEETDTSCDYYICKVIKKFRAVQTPGIEEVEL